MAVAHNKLTQEQIISLFKEVHGEAFDYSKVVYIDGKTPVEVYCKKHDFTFFPTPKNHKNGSRCTHCGRESQIQKARKDFNEFKQEMFDLYGDQYDFTDSNYTNTKTELRAICKTHGEFSKAPFSLLSGSACDECCKRQTKSNNKGIFIDEAKKVYGDKDDYTDTKVISSNYKVEVRCTKHNVFFKKDIQSYLAGCGCPKCSAENYSLVRTKTNEQFIKESKEIHENNFDYTNTVYTSAKDTLFITCKKHNNTFECYPDNHLKVKSGGCKKCHSEEISARYIGKEGVGGYTRSGYITQANGREAIVYLIKCYDENEEFYKIGKTFLGTKIRFKGKRLMPYNFVEIDFYKGNAGDIYDLEVMLHKKYKEYKYRPDFWFAGHTECYTKNLPINQIFNF